MNLQEIEKRLAEIKRALDGNHDPELAHIREDALWRDVLKAISEGSENSKELAKKCLESQDIVFPRWYA